MENGLLVTAYKDVKKSSVVHVFKNPSEEETHVCVEPAKQVRTFTTDNRTNLGLSIQSLNDITIPARSVVTVVNE